MAWYLTTLSPRTDRTLAPSASPRRACLLAARAVAWAVMLVVGAAITVAVLVPRLGGATPYTILTGSMRPHLPPGTLVVARPVEAHEISVGTVLTYQLKSGDPTVVTHRVVAISKDSHGALLFQTQGDANPAPDQAWVRPVQVRGELWYAVPGLGYPSTALSGSQRQQLSVVFALGLFAYAAAMGVGAVRDRRGSGRLAVAGGRAVTARHTARSAVVCLLVTTVLLAVPATAAEAVDAAPLGVSADGQVWSPDLGRPLFDPSLVWVPGDVQSASFFVRNQSGDRGRLSLRVDATDAESLLGDPDVSVTARLAAGPWMALANDRAFHEFTGVLGAGRSARVEVRASFDPRSGNSSQRKALAVQFRALLVQDTKRDASQPGAPSHLPAFLAFTGAPLLALLGVGLLLIAVGRLLLAARRREDVAR